MRHILYNEHPRGATSVRQHILETIVGIRDGSLDVSQGAAIVKAARAQRRFAMRELRRALSGVK